MTVSNPSTLDDFAVIAAQTYLEPDPETGEDPGSLPVMGANGSVYTEVLKQIDGPLGFQARAFLNDSTNKLVIAFAGTEGLQGPDLSGSKFYGGLPLMTPRPNAPANPS
tara:strand:- start:198 stop:524 length:327 start_codon:yes stop_codon:yes gene_type:complete